MEVANEQNRANIDFERSLHNSIMPSNSPVRTVAVIGAGPSGLSAVKALDEEKAFDTIRVFERRDRVGGTWYDNLSLGFFVSDTLTDCVEVVR